MSAQLFPTRKGLFKKELTTILNKYSMESDSNTPDFILADYVCECLEAYNKAINTREEKWLLEELKTESDWMQPT